VARVWKGRGYCRRCREDRRSSTCDGGEKDMVETVEKVRRSVLGVVRGEMVVMGGSGHLLPVEVTDEVAGLIKGFLGKITV